jgi:dynactin 1
MTKEVNESSLKLEAIQSKNETINDSKEFLQLREELSNLTILLEKEKKESEDLQLKLNSLVNSSKAKESEISSLLQENEKLKNSLKDQENNLLQITNLKKQLTQIESQSVTDDSKQNMKTIEEFTAKVTAYEEQIAELMDTIEFLTLDKEQLMVEKELLDESLKRLNSSEQVNAHAVTSDSTQQLIEENGKLREALRRLNQLSASESSKHETDIKNLKEELNNLRKNHIDSSRLSEENHQLKEEIEELRAIVDASASYESMIESLTETNLNLTQRLQQTKESLNDLQTEQELMEELDSRQRQEIEDIRRELDQARVALLTSENVSKALNDKLESSKMIEEKFKR